MTILRDVDDHTSISAPQCRIPAQPSPGCEMLTSQDSTFLTAGHHPAQGIASRTGHCKFREQAGQLSVSVPGQVPLKRSLVCSGMT